MVSVCGRDALTEFSRGGAAAKLCDGQGGRREVSQDRTRAERVEAMKPYPGITGTWERGLTGKR